MIDYPRDLSGPQFDQGDLVTFALHQATLTFRLPSEYLMRRERNFVAGKGHFKSLEPKWETDDVGWQSLALADQTWIVEDRRTTHDVARYGIQVVLVRLPKEHQEKGAPFDIEALEGWLKEFLQLIAFSQQDLDSVHFSRIERHGAYWSKFLWSFIEGKAPSPFVTIPINAESALTISISMSSFHYDGWTNLYSRAELKDLENTLFNSFLDNLHVEYAEELQALV